MKPTEIAGRALALAAIIGLAPAAMFGTAVLLAFVPVAFAVWPVAYVLHTRRMVRRRKWTSAQMIPQPAARRRTVANDVKAFARTRRG